MVECTDISQKLIDMKGSIDITNTMDWATIIRIDDPEYGITEATVSLNNPFSYRGYRFFQAQAASLGNARSIKLLLTPEKGGEAVPVEIMRNGSADLPDGTKIGFESFHPDFVFDQQGQPNTRSVDYNNPAAVLSVTTPGEKKRAFSRLPTSCRTTRRSMRPRPATAGGSRNLKNRRSRIRFRSNTIHITALYRLVFWRFRIDRRFDVRILYFAQKGLGAGRGW